MVDLRASMGSPTSFDKMPVDQLCQRVNAAIERESRKVSAFKEEQSGIDSEETFSVSAEHQDHFLSELSTSV